MIYVLSALGAERFNPPGKTIAIRCLGSVAAMTLCRQYYGDLKRRLYLDVLSLTFDDIVPEDMEADPVSTSAYKLFDYSHAGNISQFLDKHHGKFENIMVHCYAGVSRSAAIGAAIGDHFGLEYDPEILARSYKGVNNHVYATLLNHFGMRFPDGRIDAASLVD
jgi:hypothetical protein